MHAWLDSLSARHHLTRVESSVFLLATVSGFVSAFVFYFSRGALWEDEIIAVTHGLQPFPSFFVEVLRNDIHPFTYFLLLKLWSSISMNDAWLLANSVAGAFVSTAVIWFSVKRLHGSPAALFSVAWLCVLPNFAWAAANLRMYSWLPGLVVLSWYLNRQSLRHAGATPVLIGTMVVQVLTAYVHAIELFFLAFVALSALTLEYKGSSRSSLRRWVMMQVATTIFILPLCVSALIRGTEPLPAPSLLSLLVMPLQMFSGWALGNDPTALLASGLLCVFLIALALIHKDGRKIFVVLPLAAIVASILLGSLGKPMFKAPVFTANLVPFFCIAAGIGFTAVLRIGSLGMRYLLLLPLLTMALVTWPWAARMHFEGQPSEYTVAQMLSDSTRPGDVVLIPNVSIYWGIVRYATTPRWGYPLDVMPMDDKPMWQNLKHRLGPLLCRALGLDQKTDFLVWNGVKYVIGNEGSRHTATATRLWVIHKARYKENVNLGTKFAVQRQEWVNSELVVSYLEPAEEGVTILRNPVKSEGGPSQ